MTKKHLKVIEYVEFINGDAEGGTEAKIVYHLASCRDCKSLFEEIKPFIFEAEYLVSLAARMKASKRTVPPWRDTTQLAAWRFI